MALFRKAIEKLTAGLAKTRQKFMGGLRPFLTSGGRSTRPCWTSWRRSSSRPTWAWPPPRRSARTSRRPTRTGASPRASEVLPFLKEELKKLLAAGGPRACAWPPARPTVILVAGINGGGQDHLASPSWPGCFKEQGKKVVLAAADTFRAAAVEQLTIWAERHRRGDRQAAAGPTRRPWSSTPATPPSPARPTCCWWTRPGGCTRRTT